MNYLTIYTKMNMTVKECFDMEYSEELVHIKSAFSMGLLLIERTLYLTHKATLLTINSKLNNEISYSNIKELFPHYNTLTNKEIISLFTYVKKLRNTSTHLSSKKYSNYILPKFLNNYINSSDYSYNITKNNELTLFGFFILVSTLLDKKEARVDFVKRIFLNQRKTIEYRVFHSYAYSYPDIYTIDYSKKITKFYNRYYVYELVNLSLTIEYKLLKKHSIKEPFTNFRTLVYRMNKNYNINDLNYIRTKGFHYTNISIYNHILTLLKRIEKVYYSYKDVIDIEHNIKKIFEVIKSYHYIYFIVKQKSIELKDGIYDFNFFNKRINDYCLGYLYEYKDLLEKNTFLTKEVDELIHSMFGNNLYLEPIPTDIKELCHSYYNGPFKLEKLVLNHYINSNQLEFNLFNSTYSNKEFTLFENINTNKLILKDLSNKPITILHKELVYDSSYLTINKITI